MLEDKYRYTIGDLMAYTRKSRSTVVRIMKALGVKPHRAPQVRGQGYQDELRPAQARRIVEYMEK